MIGIIANASEYPVVREFFELFKTPWEFCRSGHAYDVVLCCGDGPVAPQGTSLLLRYFSGSAGAGSGDGTRFERESVLQYRGRRIPIYRGALAFQPTGNSLLVHEECGKPALIHRTTSGRPEIHIGYDLFAEVHKLLTEGQPAEHASSPTLDLHIALLRELIVSAGVPLVEIPPIPAGYAAIACLTHDVDHPSLRMHGCDHTAIGFLYRATAGALLKALRGKLSLRDLLANWLSALKFPLVHLGLARDPWSRFPESYREIEREVRSTFFVIPFRGRPGKTQDGSAPAFRASRYGAADIAASLSSIRAAGSEIALHGIDAWHDSASAGEELAEIRRLTGLQEIGVRMHWLYFDEQAPCALEQAGATYDSTVGYRETVGYRSGTLQAYKPLQAERLLELPLHAMDTALLYPAYCGYSAEEAGSALGRLVADLSQFGGCLTINWHDRSLAPERLWYAPYAAVAEELRSRQVWFATAGDAVSWFRRRRRARFVSEPSGHDLSLEEAAANDGDDLPALQVRTYRGGISEEGRLEFCDVTLRRPDECQVSS